MRDVDVVIPTWNGRELLARCLTTLMPQVDPRCLIVVDNGSEDGTDTMVRERFPDVRLVRVPSDRGFPGAVNAGIRAGDAPYVVLVNNDVECDPGFVERLVAPLRGSPSVGMVAALLLRPGRAAVDSFGIEVDRTLAGYGRYEGRAYTGSERLDDAGLLGPSGGAAAYRRAALAEVGLFDERIFFYMEDVDLALRLRAADWGADVARGSIGVHLGSATIGKRSRRQVETAGASRAYVLRKYGVLRSGIRTAMWAVTLEAGVVAVDMLLARDLAALRGRIEGWRRAAGVRAKVSPGVENQQIGFLESLRRRRAALR